MSASVQNAHDEFQRIFKQVKERKKKNDPDGKGLATSYPPPAYAQNGAYAQVYKRNSLFSKPNWFYLLFKLVICVFVRPTLELLHHIQPQELLLLLQQELLQPLALQQQLQQATISNTVKLTINQEITRTIRIGVIRRLGTVVTIRDGQVITTIEYFIHYHSILTFRTYSASTFILTFHSRTIM